MLLGEEFGAAQALAWGIASQVVPKDELDAAAHGTAVKLAALSPEVSRCFKRVLNEVGLPAFSRAIALENEAQRALGPKG